MLYPIPDTLGYRLRQLRQSRDETIRDLAERICKYPSQISRIELNKDLPNTSFLVVLCLAFDVTPNYLLCGSNTWDGQKFYVNGSLTLTAKGFRP